MFFNLNYSDGLIPTNITECYKFMTSLLFHVVPLKIKQPIIPISFQITDRNILSIITDYSSDIIKRNNYIILEVFGIEFGIKVIINDKVVSKNNSYDAVDGSIFYDNIEYKIFNDPNLTYDFFVVSYNDKFHIVEQCSVCEKFSSDYTYKYICYDCNKKRCGNCDMNRIKIKYNKKIGQCMEYSIEPKYFIGDKHVGKSVQCDVCKQNIIFKQNNDSMNYSCICQDHVKI